MKPRTIVSLLTLAAGLASPALGQFTQYTPPGGADQLEPSRIQDKLETAIEDSRWRFGDLFLDPWIQLKDVAYDDNVGNRPDNAEQLSDFTATFGLGLRGYVPIGARGTLALHALPEYIWWNELSERNRVNGRYGVGFFTLGQRFDLALSATAQDDTRFFSREFEDRVNVTDERGAFSLDFALGRGFALVTSATLVQLGFEAQDDNAPNIGRADREEQVARMGIRRRLASGLSVAVGIEASKVEFADRSDLRANSGDAPYVELALDREIFSTSLFVAARDTRFEGDTLAFKEPSGRFWAAWQPIDGYQLQIFGGRSLVYSFQDEFAFFEDSSLGVAFSWKAGSRFSARLFTEEGVNDYTAFDPLTASRSDDFKAVGGRLELKLGKLTTIIGASRTKYDSSSPLLDRTVETVTIGVTLGSTSPDPWT